MTIVNPIKDPDLGWPFSDDFPRCTLDPVLNANYLRELYFKSDPTYAGKISVPLLWDTKLNKAVSSESGDMIIMLNDQFNEYCPTEEQRSIDLYPVSNRKQIDEVIDRLQSELNLGVYKTGLSTIQQRYDANVATVFTCLDWCESILRENRFLLGNAMTLADVRLFTSLIRFDPVYCQLFKCNLKRIVDYPNLHEFMCDLYNLCGISETVDMNHILQGYYCSFKQLDPTGIVPIGPRIELGLPIAVKRRQKFA